MTTRAAWLALACPALAGCLTFNWNREAALEPPAKGALAGLQPGAGDLGASLAALGAPLYVWEQQDGAALAWGWYAERQRGLNVSVPISNNNATISFDYKGIDQGVRGVVLFFDAEWKLVRKSEGALAELASLARRARPALPEDE